MTGCASCDSRSASGYGQRKVDLRSLLFASVDPGLAGARGVAIRLLGLVFLVLLADRHRGGPNRRHTAGAVPNHHAGRRRPAPRHPIGKEITVSTHVRLGPDGDMNAVAETAASFAGVGLDLAIVYLPPEQQSRDVLGPLADALAPLA